MRKIINLWYVYGIMTLFCCLTALSSVVLGAEEKQATHITPLAQEFKRAHGANWAIRLSADKKRIASVVGMSSRSYGKQPVEAARVFLKENAKLFGLVADLSDLRVLTKHSSKVGGNIEFQQVVNGLPVDNARLQINLSRDGRILQVVNNYAPLAPKGPTTPELSKEQAIDTSIVEFLRTTPPSQDMRKHGHEKFTPLPRSELKLKETPSVEDVYFALDGHPVRAFKVVIIAIKPLGFKEFIVNASSGQILQTKDRDQHVVDGTGQVFIPNPVASLNDNTITHISVPNTNPNPYYTVNLLNLYEQLPGLFVLSGPFANVLNIELPFNMTAKVIGSPNFIFQNNSDEFGDTMVYYHLDRIQRYIQELGFVDVNNRPVLVDSRGLKDDCDAHYFPLPKGAGYLAFGLCNLFERVAEDAEVIAHEYGHALQDNVTYGKYPGKGMPGSMGEGFGDYWGMTNYANELTAAGHYLGCIGDWIGDGACQHRLDTGKTMDDYNAASDVHDNGEIWSQTLFNLFNTIGKTTTDRIVLQSHFNVPDNVTFKQAADAMVTADLQIFYGSHIPQLCQEFLNRKIYVAGDCPAIPPNTGAQSTLVVIASFKDLPSVNVSLTNAATIFNNMDAYLREVSLTQANLGTPAYRWVSLNHDRAYYYDQTTRNMLVDMVQDIIDEIHKDESGFDFSVVDRLIVITNDDGSGGVTGGEKEWATTGPWPYTIPTGAGTKRFSVSINSYNQTEGQFDHALGHHFGMIDLYAHEGVTFPRPYADGWSNMAKAPDGSFNNVHFFAWDKTKPQWLSGANITFIPRPPADPDPAHLFERTYPIYREETASSNPVILQVGTTPNVSQRIHERLSYYIEARQKSGTYDSALPSDAVLVYQVNEDIGQGFGPLHLIDAVPGTSNDLTDAGLLPAPGNSTLMDIDGSGLIVEVLPKVGTEDYRVHITYDPHEIDNDVWIHPHDSNWKSPDIWIDSPACNRGFCKFDADEGRTETDRGDKPQPNTPNRIYARIFNRGPGTAHDVRVDFYVSEPWHVIDGGDVDPATGGNVAFNHHFVKFVGDVLPTDTGMPVYMDWTPTTPPSGHVHTCIKVKIATVVNDINPAYQASQENIDEYNLTSHSPYPPVQDDFKVVNPYDHSILVYLRPDDVPVGWSADIVPKKAFIPVGGSINASMTIQAPQDYPICSTEYIKATAWYPAGDTLVPLGASVAQVNLKKSTDLTTITTYESCGKRNNIVGTISQGAGTTGSNCREIKTQGCTNPKRPFEHITVTYTGPDGNPIYHDVITDKDGCFEDFLINPQGGIWEVEAHYQGGVCTAPSDGPQRTVVVFPGGVSIPPGIRARLWYSLHLGMNFPNGSFKENFDPGPSLTADIEYLINDRYSLELLYGAHFFDERETNIVTGSPHANLIYRNLSLNARAYFPFTWAQLYVQAGPGRYFPNYGSTVSGANAGLGLSLPLTTNFKFEIGGDLHIVDPSGTTRRFVDYTLGASFRF